MSSFARWLDLGPVKRIPWSDLVVSSGHSAMPGRRWKKNYEKNKFLLGGNFRDPLNLNSLSDEKVCWLLLPRWPQINRNIISIMNLKGTLLFHLSVLCYPGGIWLHCSTQVRTLGLGKASWGGEVTPRVQQVCWSSLTCVWGIKTQIVCPSQLWR